MTAERLDPETLSRPGDPAVASDAALFADTGDGSSDVGPVRSPALYRRASVTVVEDVDGYEKSVHGVSIRSMRTGRGLGPNTVLAANADDFVATSVDLGFPMLNRTSISDDRFAVASIRSAPGGARWSGIGLRPGMTFMYGPGAEHLGINPAGLSFAFVVVETRVIEELADSLGRRLRPPPRGSVSALPAMLHATAFGDALSSFLQAAAVGTTPQASRRDEVLYRLTAALSDDRPSQFVKRTRKIDRRRLIRTCIDYADATARVPSVKELCLAAHVSERLLRDAFVDECGMPTAAFLRIWALNESRRRLRAADRYRDSVTNVATSAGIRHLGRFANRYERLFGELPLATLRSHT